MANLPLRRAILAPSGPRVSLGDFGARTTRLVTPRDTAYTMRATAELFARLDALGYDAWMVAERCGDPVDCRNLISLPRSRGFHFPRESAWARAVRANQLVRMPDLASFRQVLPCCAPGGACCRRPEACCTKRAVDRGAHGHAGLHHNRSRP